MRNDVSTQVYKLVCLAKHGGGGLISRPSSDTTNRLQRPPAATPHTHTHTPRIQFHNAFSDRIMIYSYVRFALVLTLIRSSVPSSRRWHRNATGTRCSAIGPHPCGSHALGQLSGAVDGIVHRSGGRRQWPIQGRGSGGGCRPLLAHIFFLSISCRFLYKWHIVRCLRLR